MSVIKYLELYEENPIEIKENKSIDAFATLCCLFQNFHTCISAISSISDVILHVKLPHYISLKKKKGGMTDQCDNASLQMVAGPQRLHTMSRFTVLPTLLLLIPPHFKCSCFSISLLSITPS